ncbi:MAG: acetyl-CoA C-acyltransferase FadI [Myxococcota bacterium]|jgi:acetyl-CoA acyltransferase|nr:acetyl-CoA C-acyltransferase FadI [Myxococcota bacterium]
MNGKRVAIVDGVRTPFVKYASEYKDLSTLDMGKMVVGELIERTNIDREELDQVVFGQVAAHMETHNIAREIVLGCALPRTTDAFSVSRACATSSQSLIAGAMSILCGDASVAITGGAESSSNPPIKISEELTAALVRVNGAKTLKDKAKPFLELKPNALLPNIPSIKEQSTGETMGQCAERMAKENAISREDQDLLSYRSHQNAAKAWEAGHYGQEVMTMTIPPKYKTVVEKDTLIRPDTSLEKLAKLRPAFDKKYGTVTAGNSSGLTDGASAVLLMEEEKAKALGYTPLAYVKSWAFTAVDPAWQLLIGPAFAIPKALGKINMQLSDMDLLDIHEAFAAQVLSVTQALGSASFAKEHLNASAATGEVDMDKVNVNGGSIALGHPFGATGARQALSMARELNRRGGGHAVVSQCAAGGLAAAIILEAA